LIVLYSGLRADIRIPATGAADSRARRRLAWKSMEWVWIAVSCACGNGRRNRRA